MAKTETNTKNHDAGVVKVKLRGDANRLEYQYQRWKTQHEAARARRATKQPK